jgi:hypothetical protein
LIVLAAHFIFHAAEGTLPTGTLFTTLMVPNLQIDAFF